MLSVSKILVLSLAQVTFVHAAPFRVTDFLHGNSEDVPKPVNDASLWLYLGVAAALVLLGGAFAGLTIALMGQV